jgi:ADP-heptose:LPS heptosyltransferase
LKKNPTKNIDMRLLVIRTSSMGDVALMAPVLESFRKMYNETELLVLTRPSFRPLLPFLGDDRFFFPDFAGRHRGFAGLFRLYRDIRRNDIGHVIDLHDVLRSKILCLCFRLSGVSVSVIDKGRKEKRALINGKARSALKHTVIRYSEVFEKAGFPVVLTDGPWIIPQAAAVKEIPEMDNTPGILNIGVAPYAKHPLKEWPEENMIKLLGMISGQCRANFWLFGGREESEKLSSFASRTGKSFIVAGKFDLYGELALISRLDLMIAMDSANMHLAALSGVKVLSIWGATDPVTGFGAWGQPENRTVSIPAATLTCRPCTVFGKGTCRRGDFACMNWMTPEKVFERLRDLKIL